MATREMAPGAHQPMISQQTKSVVSVLAIVAAIASFIVGSAALKFGLAIGAFILGLVGMAKALSPRVSGGVLSMLAIGLSAIAVIVAILDAVGLF